MASFNRCHMSGVRLAWGGMEHRLVGPWNMLRQAGCESRRQRIWDGQRRAWLSQSEAITGPRHSALLVSHLQLAMQILAVCRRPIAQLSCAKLRRGAKSLTACRNKLPPSARRRLDGCGEAL